MRRGKVYVLSWQIEAPDGGWVRVFGVLKCDWFAENNAGYCNWQIPSRYMNAQGMLYLRSTHVPIKYRGVIELRDIWKIERFPRKDFDRVR